MLSVIEHRPERSISRRKVVVIGAGVGGLSAALLLAAKGFAVTLVERSMRAGGKIRTLDAGGAAVDSGPTVFTMPWVFEAIFAAAGERLDRHLKLTRAQILARHSWEDGSTFDLHADLDQSADSVARLAGPDEAKRFLAFASRTAEVFTTLDEAFMRNASPSPLGLARGAGLAGLAAMTRIQPFTSLWNVAGHYFHDPRLQQLFGRYATYCGSSPFAAPGPLMLIAHVEQKGVYLVEGGMTRIADAFETVAVAQGAVFRYGSQCQEIAIRNGGVRGVRLASGEFLEADAVVCNADPAAIFTGLLGADARAAVGGWRPAERSLSALTWSMLAETGGFALSRHNVFFSDDYRGEFDDIFRHGRLPARPTIYVAAQDRGAADAQPTRGPERLFMLVNAPAGADTKPLSQTEIESCAERMTARLRRAGLAVLPLPGATVTTSPRDFAALFPATGGALYGRSSHGWTASFKRPGARTAVRGLYLAGGAVHPGPGIPMAALSGSHAAQAVISDLASTAMSRPAAMPGGMSMR